MPTMHQSLPIMGKFEGPTSPALGKHSMPVGPSSTPFGSFTPFTLGKLSMSTGQCFQFTV